MPNIFDEMRAALAHARETMQAADQISNGLADMLSRDGRLRRVHDKDALRRMKAMLRDFDMTSGKWKKP